MDEKRCSRCREWKHIKFYAKNKSHKDGLSNCCKQCQIVYEDKRKYKRRIK